MTRSRPGPTGLRARKRFQTQLTIQTKAMELFATRGYDDTSMTDVAEAADVSPSTVFRYFPAKADLVLSDGFDPVILASFAAQPPGDGVLQALRVAIVDALGHLTPAEQHGLRERLRLMLRTPPLRAALFDSVDGPMQRLSVAVAERTGLAVTDARVRTLVGAVIGVGIATMYAAVDDPSTDIITLINNAFEQLATGLPLTGSAGHGSAS